MLIQSWFEVDLKLIWSWFKVDSQLIHSWFTVDSKLSRNAKYIFDDIFAYCAITLTLALFTFFSNAKRNKRRGRDERENTKCYELLPTEIRIHSLSPFQSSQSKINIFLLMRKNIHEFWLDYWTMFDNVVGNKPMFSFLFNSSKISWDLWKRQENPVVQKIRCVQIR